MSALSAACRTIVTHEEQRVRDERDRENRETMAMMAEDIAGVRRQRDEAVEMWNAYKQYVERNMDDDSEEGEEEDGEDDDEDMDEDDA